MIDSVPLYVVDAFTAQAFGGNPAAVCLPTKPLTAETMQLVAAEMNLSETAFAYPHETAESDYHLRWFTPTDEVDLCGHATLATAHVLWGTQRWTNPEIRFLSNAGVLIASQTDDGISLNFPAKPAIPVDTPSALAPVLGVQPVAVYRSEYDLLVELETEHDVRQCQPSLTSLLDIDTRGVIVTAPSDQNGIDFSSRFFAPRVGVPEDPVTGSSHCTLAPFWAKRFNATEMVGMQLSKRQGIVKVRLEGDRVYLAGHAVTTVSGELALRQT